jgi:serine/threonine-protein kinase RsbW
MAARRVAWSTVGYQACVVRFTDPEGRTVRITFSLFLPRDELTVPITRHIVRQSLVEIGVDGDCTHSVELALAEACTNVLKHSAADDQYEVTVEVDELHCVIRVIDTGRGFDAESLSGRPDPSAEAGRGFELMQALVDTVELTSRPERGTIVHLEKDLVLEPASVLFRLNPDGTRMAVDGRGYGAGMDDPRDPEDRTQEEIREQAAVEPPDAETSREGVEQALAEEGRSEEGTTLGEHID